MDFCSWIPLETEAVYLTHNILSNSTLPPHWPWSQHLNAVLKGAPRGQKRAISSPGPFMLLDAQRLSVKWLLMLMVNDSFVKAVDIYWELT